MPRHLSAITLTLAIILAGCAGTQPSPTPETSGSFADGRSFYLAGDYAQAFPLVLEAAREGRPEAQYAVGYMYYVGQGVDRDTEQGLSWIRRAAKAGEPRAIEALSRLAGQTIPEPE